MSKPVRIPGGFMGEPKVHHIEIESPIVLTYAGDGNVRYASSPPRAVVLESNLPAPKWESEPIAAIGPALNFVRYARYEWEHHVWVTQRQKVEVGPEGEAILTLWGHWTIYRFECWRKE